MNGCLDRKLMIAIMKYNCVNCILFASDQKEMSSQHFKMESSLRHINLSSEINKTFLRLLYLFKMPVQQTLLNVGVKRKHNEIENVDSDSVSNASDQNCNTNSVSGEKTKKDRKWIESWSKTFPWINKVTVEGSVRATCTWCKDAKRSTSMATAGTPNLQSSTFSRHENSRDHLLAAEAHTAKKRKTTVIHVAETLSIKDANEGAAAKEAQFNTMYYIAKESQPISQYNKVLKLQIKNNCPALQDSSKLYTSEESKTEMIDAINTAIEEQVDSTIHGSEYIGLIIDESTDISIHKKLNVYVKCVDSNNKPSVHFMDCINVQDGKAETIVSEIVRLFQKKEIPFSKLMTLASDGASVMTGRKSGVGVRLRELSPNLIQVHCVAHRLALAAGQACRDIQLLSEYQHTLKMIYKHFSLSAVRYNELRAISKLVEDDANGLRYITLKEPASFRWLSLGKAVEAIDDNYPAIYQTLEHEAAKGSPEAKGLLTRVKNVTFVLVTGFLRDVLSVLNNLSVQLQKELVDVHVVNTQVEITKVKLTKLQTSNGVKLQSTYQSIDSSVYRGMKLTDREQLRIQFQNSATKYLEQLLENIVNRFDESSMKTLQLLNTVLNPTGVPKNTKDLEQHGSDELNELIEIYGGENGVISDDRVKADYDDIKIVLKSLNMDLSQACTHILDHYKHIYPDFAVLATLVLVSPVTSVACERGFSVHNHIKTKGRSCLGHETVQKLMRIKEEGPAIEDFDPKPSVAKFCEMKKRRK